MSGAMPAALLAEIQDPARGWVDLVLELTQPDGVVKYMCRAPQGLSVSGGQHYEPLVSSFGRFGVRVDLGSFSVDKPDWTPRVIDRDRWLSILESRGEPFRGCALVCYLAAQRVARASWMELKRGVLSSRISGTPGGVYDLPARVGLEWLNNTIGVPITEADWPNAPADSIGLLAPLPYGLLSSATGASRGVVTLIPVSAAGTVWACYAQPKSIDAVYVNNVANTANTVASSNINGRRWTTVTFSPAIAADAVVRVDCHGYEPVGDGTGETIVDPMAQIIHCLANFAYEQSPGIAWSTGSAAFNLTKCAAVTTFHATFATGGPAVGSKCFGGDSEATPTGWQELLSWCQCWGVGIGIGFDRKLFGVIEDVHASAEVSSPALIYSADILDNPEPSFARADWQSCKGVDVSYGTAAAGRQDVAKIRDSSGDDDGYIPVSLSDWGPVSAR